MLRSLDLALFRLLRRRGHTPPVERAVITFTHTGEHGVLWLTWAAVGLVLDPSGRRAYLHALRAVLITYAVNTALKQLLRRKRPELEGLPALIPVISGMSYPSAHASMSFAGASALSAALPAAPLYATAAAMALSRPYVGVHYPSDVLAGAALGSAMARLVP